MAKLNYNTEDHQAYGTFKPLPAGWYATQIVGSEMKENDNGSYLELKHAISEAHHPEHAGRFLFDRLHLGSSNPKAVDISNRILKSICNAVGHVGILTDSEDLHGIPMACRVRVRPADDTYDASNQVHGYDALGARFGGGGAMLSPANTSSPPKEPSGQPGIKKGEGMPWSK